MHSLSAGSSRVLFLSCLLAAALLQPACKGGEFSGSNAPAAVGVATAGAEGVAVPTALPSAPPSAEVTLPSAAPELPPIKVSLGITREKDTALMTNCLKASLNGGPDVDLGCNKGALVPTVTVDAKPKPACNTLRLVLYSNGAKNRSTEDTAQVARDFQFARDASGIISVKCNDNGDRNWNDLNLKIDARAVNLTIENSALPCL